MARPVWANFTKSRATPDYSAGQPTPWRSDYTLTDTRDIWEALWPIGTSPADFSARSVELSWKTWMLDHVLATLATQGPHPEYGKHYQQLALLFAKAAERLMPHVSALGLTIYQKPSDFLPLNRLNAVLSSTPGLPDTFTNTITRIASRITP